MTYDIRRLGYVLVIQLYHITFFMARRYRRKVRSGRRRRGFRRRTGVRKALSRVRSLSRKIAGEVKKIDVNSIVPETSFT